MAISSSIKTFLWRLHGGQRNPGLSGSVPRSVAIIMDGNGRWAARRGLPIAAGHEAGARAVKRVVKAAASFGIEELTLYSFSTENWARPPEEVAALMSLFSVTLDREVDELHQSGVKLVFIGRRDMLSPELRARMERSESLTCANEGLRLFVALNYGGRAEIVDAVRALMRKGISPEDVTEASIAENLYAPQMRDPDLVIRTSGEKRLSNFLLWQTAYSELYFTETLWPDFDEASLRKAIMDYAARERRFGGRQRAC